MAHQLNSMFYVRLEEKCLPTNSQADTSPLAITRLYTWQAATHAVKDCLVALPPHVLPTNSQADTSPLAITKLLRGRHQMSPSSLLVAAMFFAAMFFLWL